MSYMKVFQALEPGDVVTFNDSGGANAPTSPELHVEEHTNTAIQKFKERDGTVYRLIKEDGEYLLEGDIFESGWKRYGVVETVELIAESGWSE